MQAPQPWLHPGPWLIGLAISALQIVLLAGLAPAFRSGELALQILVVALLAGHALGYRVPLVAGLGLSVLASLTAPYVLGLRALAGQPIVVALGCLWAALASAGLARLALQWYVQNQKLQTLYTSEMLGAACGFALARMLGVRALMIGFPVLVGLALLATRRPKLCLLCLLLLGVPSSESWGRQRDLDSQLDQPTVLDSRYSPYQLVEVVRSGGHNYLFLNGLCHHDPEHLKMLDEILAGAPARLAPLRGTGAPALVLGAGALSSVRATRQQGWPTTVVELDPQVLALSQRHFAPELAGDAGVTWVCDDARAFLKKDHRQYGLIVFSLPYPYSLNAASLFTRQFFESLDQRLSPNGVISLYLGTPIPRGQLDSISGPFLRAARMVWPKAVGVSSPGAQNSAVYLSREAILDPLQVQRALLAMNHRPIHLYKARELDNRIGRYHPATLNDLRFCAKLNLDLWSAR